MIVSIVPAGQIHLIAVTQVVPQGRAGEEIHMNVRFAEDAETRAGRWGIRTGGRSHILWFADILASICHEN